MAEAAKQLAYMARLDEARARDELLRAFRKGLFVEAVAESYIGLSGHAAMSASSASKVIKTDRQILSTSDWIMTDPDWEHNALRRNTAADPLPPEKRQWASGPILSAEGVRVWKGLEKLAAHIRDGEALRASADRGKADDAAMSRPRKQPGRPRGTGMQAVDRPKALAVLDLFAKGEVSSIAAGARQVVGKDGSDAEVTRVRKLASHIQSESLEENGE